MLTLCVVYGPVECKAQRTLLSWEAGEVEPPLTGRTLLFIEPRSPASCLCGSRRQQRHSTWASRRGKVDRYTETKMGGKIGHWEWTEVWVQIRIFTVAARGTQQWAVSLEQSQAGGNREPRVNGYCGFGVSISQHLALNLLTSHHSPISQVLT